MVTKPGISCLGSEFTRTFEGTATNGNGMRLWKARCRLLDADKDLHQEAWSRMAGVAVCLGDKLNQDLLNKKGLSRALINVHCVPGVRH